MIEKFIRVWFLIAAYCLLPAAFCFAQGTPGTVRCPSQADTLDSLFRIKDSSRTNLTTVLTNLTTTISVTSTSSFPASGSIKIDNEIIFYTSKTSTTFNAMVRGADGTTAVAHPSGAVVTSPILSVHHNTLAAAIICTEGIALAAVPQTTTVNGHALSGNVTVSKSDVGLGNADNTSDANKPVSTAQLTALNLKAPLNSPTFTGTVSGITKTMVGLGNVPNVDTSTTANITDSSDKRFVSDAQRAAIGFCGSAPAGTVIVTCPPYNADNTGATSPYAAFAAAMASGAKRIRAPAGLYKFTQADVTAHSWLIDFYFAGDNVELFGDGVGRTIITVENGVTYNAGDTTIVNLNTGRNQSVHDITFQGPATYTSGTPHVIQTYIGALYPHIYNVEIAGWSGDASAGAEGIGLGQDFKTGHVHTTLGTTIVAGTRTVTPGSMNGIFIGGLLRIDYIDDPHPGEFVVVTAVTATTFTAVFAQDHSSTAPVDEQVTYFQGALVENFNIHDMGKATAIVVGSSGNTIQRGTINKVGLASTQHGLYVQGGYNRMSELLIRGAYGYSIHQFPNGDGLTDSSGNVYDKIESENPAFFHLLVSDEFYNKSDGRNPYNPLNTGLTRFTTVTNCIFRNTMNSASFGGINLAGPTIFKNNILEDVNGFISRSPYSIVDGNIVRTLYGPAFQVNSNIGGGVKQSDHETDGRFVLGQSSYPRATSNTTGGSLDFAPGAGTHRFTVVSNTAGSVALTITFNPPSLIYTSGFTLTSGTEFALGSSNTDAQKAVTAANLAEAINSGTNAGQFVHAEANGPDVYVMTLPGKTVDLLLATNQSGRISVTNGPAGDARMWNGLRLMPNLQSKPTCDATKRGTHWFVAGGAGVADSYEICSKDAADVYAWRALPN